MGHVKNWWNHRAFYVCFLQDGGNPRCLCVYLKARKGKQKQHPRDLEGHGNMTQCTLTQKLTVQSAASMFA